MKILLPSLALFLGVLLAMFMTSLEADSTPVAAIDFESLPTVNENATTSAVSSAPLLISSQPAENPARQILQRVSSELQSHASITARVRYQIDLFDQRLIGAGSYFQMGDQGEKKSRFELRVQRGNEFTSWTQVCDGRFLWTAADTMGEPLLTRLDLQLVRQRQESKTGTSSFADGTPWTWAGLPKLLRGLMENFEWDQATAGTLDPGQTAVWALRGTWKSSALNKLWPELAPATTPTATQLPGNMPGQFPGSVTLYIRQSDFFPLRIEYRRPAGASKESVASEQFQPCLMLELTDIELNQVLPAKTFQYQPAKQQELLDVTENVLLSLGLNR